MVQHRRAKEVGPTTRSSSQASLAEPGRGTDSIARTAAEDYGRFCRPSLVAALKALNLDAVFERAEGDFVWRRQGDELDKVLDLTGGFGAGLFGHNHPRLVETAKRLLDLRVPRLVQGSCRAGAARLAKELCDRLDDDYVVTFTNSGAETVEAAIKHAILETGKNRFWAVKGAFHGKTTGAVQLTSSYREPFAELGPAVSFFDPNRPDEWERIRAEDKGHVAAAFAEPILGEGGVKPLPEAFVQWLNEACSDDGIPIVVDEIQTGLGRTGTFLASEALGLRHDYLCLSKALGGGLAKIGALLIKRKRFVDEFSLLHTSTFAEDDFGCLMALECLDLLEDDGLLRACDETGSWMLERLNAIRERFPSQIEDVRGRGLMMGVEFADQTLSSSVMLSIYSQNGYLGWLIAAYFLNVHKIRVAPTLSNPLTIRIQPSAYVSKAGLRRFTDALELLCEAIQAGDATHLTSFQIGVEPGPVVDYRTASSMRREAPETIHRVAFIGHFISPNDAPHSDPSLGALPASRLPEYLRKTSGIVGPTIVEQMHVRSRTGDRVHLTFIGLNLFALQIAQERSNGNLAWIREKIEEAVALAKDLGCGVVGLGGYTSGLTGNCLRVRTDGIGLTSGNALVVGMALRALSQAVQEMGLENGRKKMAVVGVPGNIASTCGLLLAREASSLGLISHSATSKRLESLVGEIKSLNGGTDVTVSHSLDSLRSYPIVVSATSAGRELIEPAHLSRERAVICDISVPPDVSSSVHVERPEARVIAGGLVRLPVDRDFRIPGIPLEPGSVFACMAETLLMGLEGMTEHGSYGKITLEQVESMMRLAEKHGFSLHAPRVH